MSYWMQTLLSNQLALPAQLWLNSTPVNPPQQLPFQPKAPHFSSAWGILVLSGWPKQHTCSDCAAHWLFTSDVLAGDPPRKPLLCRMFQWPHTCPAPQAQGMSKTCVCGSCTAPAVMDVKWISGTLSYPLGSLKHNREKTSFSVKLLVKEKPNMGSRLASRPPRKTKCLTRVKGNRRCFFRLWPGLMTSEALNHATLPMLWARELHLLTGHIFTIRTQLDIHLMCL